jgi:hypothetical protein
MADIKEGIEPIKEEDRKLDFTCPEPREQPNQPQAIMLVTEMDTDFKIQIQPEKFKAILSEVKEVSDLQTDIFEVVAYAEALTIEDDEVMEEAVAKGKELQAYGKRVEAAIKPIKQYIDTLKDVPLAKEKEFKSSSDKAKNMLAAKILEYRKKKAEEERLAEEKRQKEEQAKIARKLARLKKTLEGLTEKAGTLAEERTEVEGLLEASDISEEEAAVLRTRLSAIDAQMSNVGQKAETAAAKVEEPPPPPPPPPAAKPLEKVKGTVTKQKVTVTVINSKVLIKAIAEGKVPVKVVKFADAELKKCVGMEIELPGCSVKKEDDMNFR